MASVRFADLQSRPTEFLDFTSVILDEFQQLIPPFEAAFQAHMAAWRLDGKPRTTRRFTVYQNCPLPTPEGNRSGCQNIVLAVTSAERVPYRHGHAYFTTIGTLGADPA